MSGKIERIRAYPAKGEAGRELSEARLIENLGLEGDFHAAGGSRQISLLSAANTTTRDFSGKSRDLTAEQREKGLCFSRFRENISISGISPNDLRPGARLEAGGAVLEITGEVKHCYEECVLYEAGTPCALAGLSLFAMVKKGGVMRTGDSIEVC